MNVPEHLSERAAAFWRGVHADYELTPTQTELLLRALEAGDRADQARAVVAREGIVVPGRDGPKAHPAVNVEVVNRRAQTALLTQLGLDDADDPDATAAARVLARRRSGRRG